MAPLVKYYRILIDSNVSIQFRIKYLKKLIHLNILDHVFGPENRTETIFEEILKPKMDSLKAEENVFVVVYGFSGTGKTHTVCNTGDDPGFVSCAFKHFLNPQNGFDIKSIK